MLDHLTFLKRDTYNVYIYTCMHYTFLKVGGVGMPDFVKFTIFTHSRRSGGGGVTPSKFNVLYVILRKMFVPRMFVARKSPPPSPRFFLSEAVKFISIIPVFPNLPVKSQLELFTLPILNGF